MIDPLQIGGNFEDLIRLVAFIKSRCRAVCSIMAPSGCSAIASQGYRDSN